MISLRNILCDVHSKRPGGWPLLWIRGRSEKWKIVFCNLSSVIFTKKSLINIHIFRETFVFGPGTFDQK